MTEPTQEMTLHQAVLSLEKVACRIEWLGTKPLIGRQGAAQTQLLWLNIWGIDAKARSEWWSMLADSNAATGPEIRTGERILSALKGEPSSLAAAQYLNDQAVKKITVEQAQHLVYKEWTTYKPALLKHVIVELAAIIDALKRNTNDQKIIVLSPSIGAAIDKPLAAKPHEPNIYADASVSISALSETAQTSLIKYEPISVLMDDNEVVKHHKQGHHTASTIIKLAAAGRTSNREVSKEIYSLLEAKERRSNRIILNLHGDSGTGKTTVRLEVMKNLSKGIVYFVRPRIGLDRQLHKAIEAASELCRLEGRSAGLNVFFDNPIQEDSFDEAREFMSLFMEGSQPASFTYISDGPNNFAIEEVRGFGCKLTEADEESLFQCLNDSFKNIGEPIESLREFQLRTGGQKNHNGRALSFIQSYLWCKGQFNPEIQEILSKPRDYLLMKYVAACQLINLPVPTMVLDKQVMEGVRTSNEVKIKFPSLITVQTIHDDDLIGLSFGSITTGIEVCRQVGINSDAALTGIFQDLLSSALVEGGPFGSMESRNFARLLLHRLSKNRHVGAAELNGSTVAENISKSIEPSFFDYLMSNKCNNETRAEWAGTLSSIGNKTSAKNLQSMPFKKMVLSLLRIIIKGGEEVYGSSPRAFTSVSKALNKVMNTEQDGFGNAATVELVEKFLQDVDFRAAVSRDYKRNAGWDWRQRVNSTFHTFGLLHQNLARLYSRKIESDRVLAVSVRESGLAYLESAMDFIPSGLVFELSPGCKLLAASFSKSLSPESTHDVYEAAVKNALQESGPAVQVSVVAIKKYIRSIPKLRDRADELELAFSNLIVVAKRGIEFIDSSLIKDISIQYLQYKTASAKLGSDEAREVASDIFDLCWTKKGANVPLFVDESYVQILHAMLDEIRYPVAWTHHGRIESRKVWQIDPPPNVVSMSRTVLYFSQMGLAQMKESFVERVGIASYWGNTSMVAEEQILVEDEIHFLEKLANLFKVPKSEDVE